MTKFTVDADTQIHKKLHGLDHLRTLAIAYVFLFHYFILSDGQPGWLPDFAKFGWTGVDLFFVLSGFLISSLLFLQISRGKSISFGTFFLKRFFRIVPAFLVTVALYFCIPAFREKEALPSIWKFLTFTQNLGLNLKDFGTFSHAWSLCVEEHFYLFLPVILILLRSTKLFHKGYWLLLLLFAFGFAIRFYSFTELYFPKSTHQYNWMFWYKYVYYPTYNRFDGLLIGVSIAAVYRFLPTFWNTISRFGNWLLLLSLVILISANFLCENQQTFYASVFGYPVIAIGYGFMVVGAISPVSFLYKWQSKFSTFIAALSYGIYLTHKGIIHVTHQFLDPYKLNSHLMLLICVISCLIGAFLLHEIIEKPFMKWRDQIMKPKASAPKIVIPSNPF